MDKIIIIAEAGVNHNGDINLAKKLINVAAAAGVDYVKFQTFKAEKLVSKTAKKAIYQIENLGNKEGDTQFEMLKKLELTEMMHREIILHCKEKQINFLSTPFDSDSISFLKKMGLNIGKIPSGEITNLPYLREMAKTFPELVVSTGMCNLQEIEQAILVLVSAGAKKDNITILHCNTEYPTPMSDVNLKAMLTIKKELNVKVGYSDHTLGIEIPIAAAALGAIIIEKHFTLDKNMEGPDHKASLEPDQLKAMVSAIRNIEQALGQEKKEPSNSEKKNIAIVRKSIVANVDIKTGTVFTEKNIITKRPGNGISPMLWDNIIGKKATKDYLKDDLI
jgi:N,N'-diacetyllegionaminate synthase